MADGNHSSAALDIRAIGNALKVSKRAAEMRAKKESWPYVEVTAVGGRRRLYAIEQLPEDVRTAIVRAQALQAAAAAVQTPAASAGRSEARKLALAETLDGAVAQRTREQGAAAAAALTGRARERMQAKLELLARLEGFAQARGIGLCAAMEEFCDAYNSGAMQVELAVRQHTGADLHPTTLRRWRRAVATSGPLALAGRYGNRKGSGGIDSEPALRDFLLGVLVEKPHISAKLLHDLVAARMPDVLPRRRQLERWLVAWKRANAEVFLAATNPDAWKNKYMAAFGSYAEGVVRANQLWMLDSTPADLQLLDGRHSVLGVIDVASRRVMFHVSRTSTAEAVCQLLRRAILAWGVPEAVKMDNGRDYASERVAGLLLGLGIEARFSTPFSPWEKPFIERVFGTFSRHALELLPGFSGHDVAQAQAIRARKSFAEQLLAKGKVVEAKLTAAELQAFCDRWVADYYMHEPHSGEGMDGLTPFEKSARLRDSVRTIGDVRALDLLLGAGTLCTVTKKGIRLDKLRYIAPELERAMGQKVLVRRDDGDMGRVVVYHDDAFLCVAECPEVTGISRAEVAMETKARQRERVQEARRALRQAGRRDAQGDLARELLDARAREAATLSALPVDNVIHMTPHLEAAATAADELAAWESGDSARRAQDAAVVASIDRVIREHQRSDETAEQRFRWCMDALLREDALDDLERRRLQIYRDTPEFEARWDCFICFGARGVDLEPHFDALLPADAPFHSQGGI
ncbi:MAG: Mu transposase C-terminal domain-containing protein [Pigmentiphaga sp.]